VTENDAHLTGQERYYNFYKACHEAAVRDLRRNRRTLTSAVVQR
jgi:hypothetical protein